MSFPLELRLHVFCRFIVWQHIIEMWLHIKVSKSVVKKQGGQTKIMLQFEHQHH